MKSSGLSHLQSVRIEHDQSTTCKQRERQELEVVCSCDKTGSDISLSARDSQSPKIWTEQQVNPDPVHTLYSRIAVVHVY